MELPFNFLVIIIIAMMMMLLAYFFYMKIKESGIDILNQILDIPNYLKKIFGG